MSYLSIRKMLWTIVEPTGTNRLNKLFGFLILGLICLNVIEIITISVDNIRHQYGNLLLGFEFFSVIIFTIEYVIRVWTCVEMPSYQRPIWGRLKFMMTPLVLLDLLAILPFYLAFFNHNVIFLRTFRLLRLLYIAKLYRYHHSFQLILRIFKNKKEELLVTLIFMIILLIVLSCLIFYIEYPVQPQNFPDIPTTMWWGIVTLTTVGYGDVFPITGLGKLLTSIIVLIGIGTFALPAAILSTGFLEEMEKQHHKKYCPHCGKPLE